MLTGLQVLSVLGSGSGDGGPLSLYLEDPSQPFTGPEPREEGTLLEGINKG